ncbi:MAG TPA: CBS domain-containing protein [Candidatus Baltobacteraceae bacterium]|jgi:CBS domain-containing protein|nr:CBS domain-containing protein [Candidatus Baltobacteraceae bacterium]
MALKASTASDIMTENVEVLREDDSLQTAAERLAQHDVGALPVCDDQQQVRGIVTDRDIVVHGLAQGKDPRKTTVAEIVSSNPVTVGPDDSVQRVTEIMGERQIRRVPVVEAGRLIGIISQGDIAQSVPADQAGTMLSHISSM